MRYPKPLADLPWIVWRTDYYFLASDVRACLDEGQNFEELVLDIYNKVFPCGLIWKYHCIRREDHDAKRRGL